MEFSTRTFSIGAVCVLAAAVMFYMYQTTFAPATAQKVGEATSTFQVASNNPLDSLSALDPSKYTVKMLADPEKIVAPDYKRALTFTGKFTAAQKASIQASYAKTQAVIASDKYAFNEWVFLGNVHHITGNEQFAREIWEYVSVIWPTNQASFNNLGDLYMGYLKDYPAAEKNFLRAIVNKPDDTNPYRNLFTLYSETSYKPTNTAAEDILKKGLVANPKAVDLQVLLARYYKKLDRMNDSKAMYQAAIDNATRLGQTALATQIRTEAGLK